MFRILWSVGARCVSFESYVDALVLKTILRILWSVGARCVKFEGYFSALSGRAAPDALGLKVIFRIIWSVGARCVNFESNFRILWSVGNRCLNFKGYFPYSLVGRCQTRQFWKLFSAFSGRSAPDALVLKTIFRILWSVGARCVNFESYFSHSLVGRRQMLLFWDNFSRFLVGRRQMR